jgi:hypothetical protein
MRTLVEQTRRNVADWLSKLAGLYLGPELQWLAVKSPVVVMGGEEDDRGKPSVTQPALELSLKPEVLLIIMGDR